MRRHAILSTLAFAACSFNSTPPKNAAITCTTTADCPGGLICSKLRGLCAQRNEDDAVAPVLTGTVTPAIVRPGQTVAVVVESNEPLLGSALVEVHAGLTTRTLDPASDTMFFFNVPPEEPDGLLTFFGSADDLAGNGSTSVRLGTTLVDGTAPVASALRVMPARVAPGQSAVVTVPVSEEVSAGALFEVMTAAGAGVTSTKSTATSSLLRFDVVVPSGTADQTLALKLSSLVDLAGNSGADVTGTLEVDGTPPAIAALGLNGRRFSAVAGFNQVLLPVGVTGATTISACIDTACQPATDGQTVTFPVTGQEVQGTHQVAVRASDEVGNLAQVAEVVTFDFAAPRAQSLVVTPSSVAPGGTVAVTASFDEVLATNATLTVTSDDGSWTQQLVAPAAGGHLAAFDVLLPSASLASQAFHLQLSGVADDVANVAMNLDAGSFLLDVDPPVFLAPATGYAHRYSLMPGHDVVAVPSPAVSGASYVQICLENDCRISDGGTVSFAVVAAAGEGSHALSFRAFDAVGNLASVFDAVTFDFTAPRVLSSTIVYSPPPGCPLQAVSSLTKNGTVTLVLAIDEPIAAPPTPDAGVLPLAPLDAGSGGQAFVFGAIGPSTLVTGTLDVSAALQDDVGNLAERPLGQITVDVTPPRVPVTSAEKDLFVYTRIPFGTATLNAATFSVYADAGSFEPGARVEFWSTGNAAAIPLGSTVSTAAGSLPTVTLPPVDLAKIYYRAYDAACNSPSNGARVPVPRTDYTVTLGGKIAGSTLPNPHRLIDEYPADLISATIPTGREWGDEAARTDSAYTSTPSPALRWQGPGPATNTVACAWQDPISQSIYVLSDRAWRLEAKGLVDEGALPASILGNCTTDYNGGLIAPTYDGYITRSQGRFVFVQDGSTAYYYGNAWGPGWYTASGGSIFHMENVVDPSYMDVLRLDTSLNEWQLLDAQPPLPVRVLGPGNFTFWGGGYPLVVGDYFGGTETWALQGSYDSSVSAYQWAQLDNAPEPVGAVQGFGSSVVMVAAASKNAWVLLDTGNWTQMGTCPLAAPIIASYQSTNQHAVFVGADWSLADFNGTSCTLLAPARPALNGYRTLGHSPAIGTLTPLDAGMLLHATFVDGGSDVNWSWNGTRWTSAPGLNPGLPGGVATTAADGTIYMAGTLPGASSTTTYKYVAGTWQPYTPALPARIDHRLVLDRSNNSGALLIGGSTPGTSPAAITGYYRLSGSSWGDYTNTLGLPWSQRARAAAGTDRLRNVSVVFGGTNGAALQDTWETDTSGLGWHQVSTATSPSARAGASLVWDPLRQWLILTGGSVTPDTWIYDGNWRNMTAWLGAPPASSLAAWDGTNAAIASLGVTGDALLAATNGRVAQRFVLSGASAGSGLQPIGGKVRASVVGTSSLFNYSVFASGAWGTVGQPPATSFLSQAQANGVADYGFRIIPTTSLPTSLKLDYVEINLRYDVTN